MTTRSRGTRLMAVAAALAVAAVACGNKQSDSGGGSAGTASQGTGGAAGGFTVSTDKCDAYNGTQGISDTEIKIGSSFPQAGLYAPFAEISRGWKAFFEYTNANGGINGKKITTVTKDDGYEPSKTKTNVQELIETDKVFALFNVVGTPNNLSIRPDLNKACVPDLYAATGSQLLGNPDKYPWVIGSIPTYATEAVVFADYLKKNKPNAKVGILRQNDDFGEGYADAFKKAIDGTGITIVATETYDPGQSDVNSQITKLNAANADSLLLAVTTLTCPNAMKAVAEKQGWNPVSYVSATCASKTLIGLAGPAANGVLSSIYLMQPTDPQWDANPAMKTFKETGAKYGLTSEDVENGLVAYGWTMGDLLVQTLKGASSLDRQAVMTKAWSLKNLTPGVLLPGVSVNTNGATDPYPIEQMAIAQWNGTYFKQLGEVQNYEGKTNEYVPKK